MNIEVWSSIVQILVSVAAVLAGLYAIGRADNLRRWLENSLRLRLPDEEQNDWTRPLTRIDLDNSLLASRQRQKKVSENIGRAGAMIVTTIGAGVIAIVIKVMLLAGRSETVDAGQALLVSSSFSLLLVGVGSIIVASMAATGRMAKEDSQTIIENVQARPRVEIFPLGVWKNDKFPASRVLRFGVTNIGRGPASLMDTPRVFSDSGSSLPMRSYWIDERQPLDWYVSKDWNAESLRNEQWAARASGKLSLASGETKTVYALLPASLDAQHWAEAIVGVERGFGDSVKFPVFSNQ